MKTIIIVLGSLLNVKLFNCKLSFDELNDKVFLKKKSNIPRPDVGLFLKISDGPSSVLQN